MNQQVAIYGVGVHLPEQVRKNDWWPEATVAKWREKRDHNLPQLARWAETMSETPGLERMPGVARVVDAILGLKDDPFQGARERRVAPDALDASELEVRAAEEAIARAGIDRGEIGFVLSYSAVPDFLLVPNACAIHKRLGLPQRCLALAVEGACNTFALQLNVAEHLISSGQYRHGLLVQSSLGSRVLPSEQPASAIFGDGASAVVLGPAKRPGYGVLGRAHHTDGTGFRACAIGVPGKRWFDDGRNIFHTVDPQLGRGLILAVADHGKVVVDEALASAGVRGEDVDFYACHQGTAWLRSVTQDFFGLGHARTLDTFPWVTSLMGANLPVLLGVAEREGALRDGDLVAAFSGGLGETWSSLVLRWGRG